MSKNTVIMYFVEAENKIWTYFFIIYKFMSINIFRYQLILQTEYFFSPQKKKKRNGIFFFLGFTHKRNIIIIVHG